MTETYAFPDQPDIDPYKDKNALNDTNYIMRSVYNYATLAGTTITVPLGFKTDDFSAPSIIWLFIGLPPDGF